MDERYLRRKALLDERFGEQCEITDFGGPIQFIDCGPGARDYLRLAQDAYQRGELDVEEFEAEVESILNAPFTKEEA